MSLAEHEEALRQGIALFNRGDYFQAHEMWEDWWRATTSPEKQMVQGLIQIAVAMHHASTGNLVGATSVMERALRNLKDIGDAWHGVNLHQLRADTRRALQQLKDNKPVTDFKIVRPGSSNP